MTSVRTPAPTWRGAERGVPVGPAALAAVGATSVLWYVVVALQRIGYPYELVYFEGSTVEVSARVAAGEPLYGPPTTAFVPWPYPPLYFWLTGALARVTGVGLPTLRLVSFAASLVVIVLLALIVRRAGGSLASGVVAAGLYAATYRASGAFFDTARVDSLLLALLLAAVYAGLWARGRRGGVLVGGLLLLAFLTKQNALVVAVPVLLWLVRCRRTVGVSATLTLVLGVVASTMVGSLATGGWYWRYVFEQLPGQAWVPRWLWAFWWEDLLVPLAVSIVVSATLAVQARRDRPRAGEVRAWMRADHGYLVASGAGLVLAAWIGRLHEGGYANVAMPAHAAGAGAVGVLLATWLRAGRRTRTAGLLAAALALQVVLLAVPLVDLVPSQRDREAGDRFVATLRSLPATVLVPTHPYYLRLAGRPTHASAIAVDDLLRSRGGAERLAGVVPWSLDGVDAVVLDNPTDARLFGRELASDFTLVTSAVVPEGVFVPPTDLPTHPALLYVRTVSTLSSVR